MRKVLELSDDTYHQLADLALHQRVGIPQGIVRWRPPSASRQRPRLAHGAGGPLCAARRYKVSSGAGRSGHAPPEGVEYG